MLKRPQLFLDCGQVGGACEDVVAQRLGAPGGRSLVVQCDPGSLLPDELARRQRHLADDRAQERRLARPVGSSECEPVAALDLEGDAVEQRFARELLA